MNFARPPIAPALKSDGTLLNSHQYGYKHAKQGTQQVFSASDFSINSLGSNSLSLLDADPGGHNLYAFAANHPTGVADIDGLGWWPFHWPKKPIPKKPSSPANPKISPFCANADCQAWLKDPNVETSYDCCAEQFMIRYASGQQDLKNLSIKNERTKGQEGPIK